MSSKSQFRRDGLKGIFCRFLMESADNIDIVDI